MISAFRVGLAASGLCDIDRVIIQSYSKIFKKLGSPGTAEVNRFLLGLIFLC